MAYGRGLPLLVLVQEELRTEGLLETGYDWYVKRMRLTRSAVSDREFCGIFDDWRLRVEGHRASNEPASRSGAEHTGSSPTSVAQAKPEPAPALDRRQLRRILETRFNDDELRALCFDLRVDYENLPGATKAAKTIEIIAYFERMNQVGLLMRSVKELRPDEAL